MKILRNSFLLTFTITITVFIYVIGFRNEFLDDVVKGKTNGVFYNVKKLPVSLYKGEVAKSIKSNILSTNQERYYRRFHIGDFLIKLPYEHPLFYVSPIIEDKEEKILFGFSFYNRKNQRLLTMRLKKDFYFKKNLNLQKIFNFPSTKNFIYKKSISDFWKDLFLLDISIPQTYLFNIKDYSYKLFISHLRDLYINKNAESLIFLEELNFGLVDLGYGDGNLKYEELYLFDKDILYSFEIIFKDYDDEALDLRKRLLEGLKVQDSDKELSNIIFQEFKELNFKDKTSELGMLFLLSAWSHEIESQEYLKAAVFYLEKGQSNLINLGPLYDYAFSKYGTNFSSIKKRQKKSVEVQLQENIKKEDIESLEKNLNNSNSDVKPTDLIKLKLEKGKSSSIKESDKLYID